jgi:hypothetical protein
LMCTSDVSLITFNWVHNWKPPTPNFNTQHKCRDFETILSWAEAHARHHGELKRLGGETELANSP